MSYPNDPGFAAGSETSEHAAELIKEKAGTLRHLVFEYVKRCGMHGTTPDEARKALNLKAQSCSARFTELWQRGQIIKTSRTRQTSGKFKASVYVSSEWSHLVHKQTTQTAKRLAKVQQSIRKLQREESILLKVLELES